MAEAVVEFTTRTTDGTQAITGVGFEPVGMILDVLGVTGETLDSTTVAFCRGFADGTNQFVAYFSRNTSQERSSGVRDDAVIRLRAGSQTGHNSGDPAVQASLSSFDSDGFTLSYSFTDGVAYRVKATLFGGSGVEAVAGHVEPTSTGVTGLGLSGVPIVFTASQSNNTINNETRFPRFCVGVCDPAENQWVTPIMLDDQTDGADTGSSLEPGFAVSLIGEQNPEAISNLTAGGWDWDGLGSITGYLAVYPGGRSSFAGSFTKDDSGTTDATEELADLGFTPGLIEFSTGGHETYPGVQERDDATFLVGSVNGDLTQGSFSIGGEELTNENYARADLSHAILVMEPTDGSIESLGEVTSMDATPEITWRTNSALATRIGYWAIEAEEEDDDVDAAIVETSPPRTDTAAAGVEVAAEATESSPARTDNVEADAEVSAAATEASPARQDSATASAAVAAGAIESSPARTDAVTASAAASAVTTETSPARADQVTASAPAGVEVAEQSSARTDAATGSVEVAGELTEASPARTDSASVDVEDGTRSAVVTETSAARTDSATAGVDVGASASEQSPARTDAATASALPAAAVTETSPARTDQATASAPVGAVATETSPSRTDSLDANVDGDAYAAIAETSPARTDVAVATVGIFGTINESSPARTDSIAAVENILSPVPIVAGAATMRPTVRATIAAMRPRIAATAVSLRPAVTTTKVTMR